MESSASGSGESQSQKRSVIWMHFTNISEANAKSNLCKNIYSHKNGNISNLRKHLKTKLPILSLEGERAKRRVEDENMPRCKRNLVSENLKAETEEKLLKYEAEIEALIKQSKEKDEYTYYQTAKKNNRY
ncbi:unnamed protein product [Acanthoscelides obtectus]|uniref:BED-type domain-containing protein n=1 Tax=Acanthoscelides obtectus TaxID=200917 RepID=A0A9P0JW58_ACAOB|nr:unnamed protein product [Acanthoscelides obtectus]CAK1671267.1 hypothetical protein AOBTE_LOCUS28201 [Acanthoscelides obtectus]